MVELTPARRNMSGLTISRIDGLNIILMKRVVNAMIAESNMADFIMQDVTLNAAQGAGYSLSHVIADDQLETTQVKKSIYANT